MIDDTLSVQTFRIYIDKTEQNSLITFSLQALFYHYNYSNGIVKGQTSASYNHLLPLKNYIIDV